MKITQKLLKQYNETHNTHYSVILRDTGAIDMVSWKDEEIPKHFNNPQELKTTLTAAIEIPFKHDAVTKTIFVEDTKDKLAELRELQLKGWMIVQTLNL